MTRQFASDDGHFGVDRDYPEGRKTAEYRNTAATEPAEASQHHAPIDLQLRRLADNRAKLIELVVVLQRELSPLMRPDTQPPRVANEKNPGTECLLTQTLRDLNDGISNTIGDLHDLLSQLDLPQMVRPTN